MSSKAWKDFSEGCRVAVAIGLFGYALWAGAIALAVPDLNLKVSTLGIGITIFGVGVGLISGVLTDREIRSLKPPA
jgi:hypothetical protein